MVGGLALGSEIKRFARNRMTRIAVVILMLMPLTYGALYLWAYWDPFGHVNKLPVALVNSDRGTEVSGQSVNVGAEIAKSLTDDKSLDWHLVDDADARDGSLTAGTTSCWNCRRTSVRRSPPRPPAIPARRS